MARGLTPISDLKGGACVEPIFGQGLRAVQAPYIPTENLSKLKQIFVQYRGKARQMLIGEEHH